MAAHIALAVLGGLLLLLAPLVYKLGKRDR